MTICTSERGDHRGPVRVSGKLGGAQPSRFRVEVRDRYVGYWVPFTSSAIQSVRNLTTPHGTFDAFPTTNTMQRLSTSYRNGEQPDSVVHLSYVIGTTTTQ